MKKISMNPVSVSVRYGGYQYRFVIKDMDMGDIGIGIWFEFLSIIIDFSSTYNVFLNPCVKNMNLTFILYKY